MGEADLFTACLGRFPSIARYFPGEDIGTAVTAAVLGRVEGACMEVANMLLKEAGCEPWKGTHPPRLDTQVSTGHSMDRIDLEIAFGTERLVWIEAKRWTGEGWRGGKEPQTERYAKALYGENGDGGESKRRDFKEDPLLFFLTPSGTEPESKDANPVSWQQITGVLATWHQKRRQDHWHTWLVGQYLDYLKNEGLTMTDLDLQEIAATEREFAELRTGLRNLHNGVTAYLGKKWEQAEPAECADGSKVSKALEWWCVYELPAAHRARNRVRLEFTLDSESDYSKIWAGLIWRRTDEIRENPIDTDKRWKRDTAADKFQRREPGDDTVRLQREYKLSKLASIHDITEQANQIGKFVDETFELLVGRPRRA